MSGVRAATIGDLLFGGAQDGAERLGDGATLLRGFARCQAADLVGLVGEIAATAAFRHMVTPGGFRMSVAMTSCGEVGWVTDRNSYRYSPVDPMTGRSWPAMPQLFQTLAQCSAAAAGFTGFEPDACLINRYEPGARLSPHRDEDERDLGAPVVSVSLGVPATFLFGGLSRKDRLRRLRLESGDVVVWGGPSRLVYHGVATLAEAEDALTGRCRINLTFRKAL
ncbi:MAG TPA: DNA oxidative demethylase AlkB [Stellaceae bacterium]|nr:DNA oxidative demethylase AlkB [Stellaceae bacterium]